MVIIYTGAILLDLLKILNHDYMYQKLSKNQKPMVYSHTLLPVYTKSVQYRINIIKQLLTINIPKDQEKWWNIANDIRHLTI